MDSSHERFRTPETPRQQMVLWEHRLEDALPDDHQVRHLDLLLGSAALYLYGMLHRLRSSRRLEDACHSRLDVIRHPKHNMGLRRFMRRGIEKVKTEWIMACTAGNVGIMLGHWEEIVKAL